VPNLQYEGRKRDIPEYIQISIKKPRQKTIRSDHFFFWDITITSPFVSVSESFLSGTVDLVGPADIDLARVTSESTIVFVGDSSRGVWLGCGNALDGIIGSIIIYTSDGLDWNVWFGCDERIYLVRL